MLPGLILPVTVFTTVISLTSALCPSNADSYLYNVTGSPVTVYSHSEYESGSNYPSVSTITCLFITTAKSGHVIKLKQEDFDLEKSSDCIEDYLIIYDGDTVTHKKEDQMGTYCGTIGPDEEYSTLPDMTLYFYTDYGGTGRGFKFEASSLDKDDVPSSLGIAAIVMITVLVVAVVGLIVAIVVYVIWKKKHKNDDDIEEYEDDEESEDTTKQEESTKPDSAKTKTTST